MSREAINWQPLWGNCSGCQGPAEFRVDTNHRPLLAGTIGVRCVRCGGRGLYNFARTPEAELADQLRLKKAFEAHEAKAATLDEWEQFHLAMIGLMPQPAEPEPDDGRVPFLWRVLRGEGRGPLDRIEEDHA